MDKKIPPEKFEQFTARLKKIESAYREEVMKIIKEVDEERLRNLKDQMGLSL